MSASLKYVKDFIRFAVKHIGLTTVPTIYLVGSSENKHNAFGHFLGTRKGSSITVRITERHPIDIMRTIAHELIHQHQTNRGFAKSEQMREDEANALAGRIMREYSNAYPHVFKAKPIGNIREDGAAMSTGAGISGSAGDPDPSNPLAKPLLNKEKTAMLRRKAVLEGIINQLLAGNMNARNNVDKEKKGLGKILGHEKALEKRAETRIS
jgi:hypothetical protein